MQDHFIDRLFRCLMLFGLLALGGCASSGFKSISAMPADPGKRSIVLLNPDVELSLLHAGGITEPNAQWTKQAQTHLNGALTEKFQGSNVRFIKPAGPHSTDDEDEVQLLKLHNAVGASILRHQYQGQPLRLPTKEKGFDWSLGPTSTYLKNKYGTDYGLFVYVRDSYTSGGRVAVIILAAMFGVGVQGGTQIGFASLVDLNSGEVVWFNRVARTTGDLRTYEGAKETANTLLANFPR